MSIGQDVHAFINNSPNALLVLDRKRGEYLGASTAFFELMGFSSKDFTSERILNLPFLTRDVKHGLLRLFFKVSRQHELNDTCSFTHVRPDGTVKKISTSAGTAVFGGQECVIFTLRQAERTEKENEPKEAGHKKTVYKEISHKEESHKEVSGTENYVDSWKSYLTLAYEPYMEFRLTAPVLANNEYENRMCYLQALGESLKVKISNSAAVKFYYGGKGSLVGDTFLSFFNNTLDAIRFLDMLSVVGQMRAETTVDTYKDFAVPVEMNCVVKFDDRGAIASVYCGQRDLSGYQHYKTIIGGSKMEMGFMFNQPFAGFAFLLPPHPLERPQVENLDAVLDELVKRIAVVRANQAMTDIYGLDKAKFLMKPMRGLFDDDWTARQVLKELFIVRETSSGSLRKAAEPKQPGQEDEFERVSIYKAVFDDADRLTGIFAAASKHSYGYRPRHVSGGATEDNENGNGQPAPGENATA